MLSSPVLNLVFQILGSGVVTARNLTLDLTLPVYTASSLDKQSSQ